jgi:hypothetical protein
MYLEKNISKLYIYKMFRLPNIIDSEISKPRSGIPALVDSITLTGEQAQMVDGLIRDSMPGKKVRLPDGVEVPVKAMEKMTVEKVKASKTSYNHNLGMVHIRGVKY